ncbi:hypothetical protein D917_04680 [Trichinella nativa]|uniref:RRM domain-containing protein n=1 Tax=Trichinella nativa TaxID=6335 RepID=A0A1Y3E936_9BILA|nr:hypothetical protein D917_04680 [Trichinella nativa]
MTKKQNGLKGARGGFGRGSMKRGGGKMRNASAERGGRGQSRGRGHGRGRGGFDNKANRDVFGRGVDKQLFGKKNKMGMVEESKNSGALHSSAGRGISIPRGKSRGNLSTSLKKKVHFADPIEERAKILSQSENESDMDDLVLKDDLEDEEMFEEGNSDEDIEESENKDSEDDEDEKFLNMIVAIKSSPKPETPKAEVQEKSPKKESPKDKIKQKNSNCLSGSLLVYFSCLVDLGSITKISVKKEAQSETASLLEDEELEVETEKKVLEIEQRRRLKRNKCRLFLKDLPLESSIADVKALSNDIIHVFKPTQKSRFCFLLFANEKICEKNYEKLKNIALKGAKLTVDFMGEKGKNFKPTERSEISNLINPTELYVGDVCSKEEVLQAFPSAGSIQMHDMYAFVKFPTAEAAREAFNSADNVKLGRPIYVFYTRPKDGRKRKYEEDDDDDDGSLEDLSLKIFEGDDEELKV